MSGRPLADPELRRALRARLGFYRELGIYDLYRRPAPGAANQAKAHGATQQTTEEATAPAESPHASAAAPMPDASQLALLDVGSGALAPIRRAEDPAALLRLIRDDIGDCTRCRLHQGRKNIVFGVGNPRADLMFIGEGPGADEDEQGEPFVGRAGQLLNKMIEAMDLKRGDVYIANVVKCRPPGNRTPERDECDTCSPFLNRQIEALAPRVIVALGAVAARTLLEVNQSMAALRGRWHDYRGVPLAVTYHPAFLLRDPRQKKEAWKDLQMVMQYLGLKAKGRTGLDAQ
ncbi:MAG TPA: uracil-DNA glycosylase [Terriglobales bacterium]|nr:uracil-DNA glycosylase [Terriglobales bacterium]